MKKVNFLRHTCTHQHTNTCIYARLMKQNVRRACIRLLYQRIYTSAGDDTHGHEIQNVCAHTAYGELFRFMQVFCCCLLVLFFFFCFLFEKHSALFNVVFKAFAATFFYSSCAGSSRNFITIHNSYFLPSDVKT